MKLERKVLFFSAWDKTNSDPYKNYGVSDIRMKFLIIGNKGVVEFDLSTNWYLPHVMERRLQSLKRDIFFGKEDFLLRRYIQPYPMDICYWSLERISEDDTYFEDGLDYIFDHNPCFYGYKYEKEDDGLYTIDFVYQKFLERGDIAVWEYLENYYYYTFGKDEND